MDAAVRTSKMANWPRIPIPLHLPSRDPYDKAAQIEEQLFYTCVFRTNSITKLNDYFFPNLV